MSQLHLPVGEGALLPVAPPSPTGPTVEPTPGNPMPTVRFKVYGDPTSQGSKKPFIDPRSGKPRMKEQTGAKLKTWRAAVTEAAVAAAEHLPGPLDGALELGVTFRFPMPASRPKWIRTLRTVPKATAPDLSKLVRALEDAMKVGGVIRDDARIARLIADKIEVADAWLGAEVCVRPLRVGGPT